MGDQSGPSDHDIDRQVWGGRIPIAFTISHDESTTEDQTYYILAPRMGYLSLYGDKIREHFDKTSPQNTDTEIWFAHNGRPLKWNIPVGVLFDCFGDSTTLPWQITVHFKNYPESQIMRCTNLSVVESYLLNRLKLANYMKHNTSPEKVDGLDNQEDKKQLWLGLAQDDYEQFRRVNKKLMTVKDGHWFKRIPFRVYVIDQELLGSTMSDIEVIEEPYDGLSEDGTGNTLGNLLTYLFQDKVPKEVMVQGINPPLTTPLQWLSEHCSHPDNFVHIVTLFSD